MILHYKHAGLGQWIMLVWGFFAGPTNGMSINYLAREAGSYHTVYYLIKNMMITVYNMPAKKLSGTVEHDEGYIRAGYKGTKMDGRDGLRTIALHRWLSGHSNCHGINTTICDRRDINGWLYVANE